MRVRLAHVEAGPRVRSTRSRRVPGVERAGRTRRSRGLPRETIEESQGEERNARDCQGEEEEVQQEEEEDGFL
jgi:hypothetical protein